MIFKQTPGNDTCEVLANHSEGDAFMLTLQQTSEQLVKPATLVHQGPQTMRAFLLSVLPFVFSRLHFDRRLQDGRREREKERKK